MSDPTADFIDGLRMERLRSRLPQGALATTLGVAQGRLCDWEARRVLPTDTTLRAWAAALGVAVPEGVRGYREGPAACGTESGYYAHLHRGETTCQRCRSAHRDAQRIRRRLRKAEASPP